MEDVVSEVSNGFFRALGYLLADVFFWTVCYWTGWPVCKLVSLGRYPGKATFFQVRNHYDKRFWCAFTGLVVWVLLALVCRGLFG